MKKTKILQKAGYLTCFPVFLLTLVSLDATALDVWVLDQLRTLFRNATTDNMLNTQLRLDKVIFFLHLLGLDTTGHSYRPHSKASELTMSSATDVQTGLQEYMNNIRIVDSIVRQTEALMSEFYQDDETSYIFTADHGMSVIGNHGDGGEIYLSMC